MLMPRLLMLASMCSLVTSYCPLSLLTSPARRRVTAHRCTTPRVRPTTITTRPHTHTHTHISPLSTSYRQHVPSPLPVKHTHRQTDTSNTHTHNTYTHLSTLHVQLTALSITAPSQYRLHTRTHTKIGEDRMCSSEDMIADRETHRQTDGRTRLTHTHTHTHTHAAGPTT